MYRKQMPDFDTLKSIFSYEKDTGLFIRKDSPKSFGLGRKAGTKTCHGYIVIKIKNIPYFAHRLDFVMMGHEAPDHVDHINHIRDDNRWANLRESTHLKNSRNRALQKSNRSGFNGVKSINQYGTYEAFIYNKSKYVHLGSYQDIEDAKKARIEAEVNYGYDKNHGINFTNSNNY